MLPRYPGSTALVGTALLLVTTVPLRAETPTASGALAVLDASPTSAAAHVENPFDELILQLVREAIPREYENRKKWGLTKEAVRGLDIRFEGLELKTRRRRKTVNHGDWKMYRVKLEDPQRNLQIELHNLRQSASGNLQFDLLSVARLQTFVRYACWRQDIQLFSISADADATVRLTADCELALHIDPVHLPPDFVIVPHIHQARVELLDLQLDHLSKLHGDVAEQLGKGIREILDEVLEHKQDKLTEKLNNQLNKKKDKLRLSLHDLATSKFKRDEGRGTKDERKKD